MLRRDRYIRMQIHQLMDACLFALAFWLAHALRSDPTIADLFGTSVNAFKDYAWLYLILIPAAPLILEAQGFYNRPMLCSSNVTAWALAKGCFLTVLVLILVAFLFQIVAARGVIVFFGFTSFILVFLKEQFVQSRVRRKLSKPEFRRRFILIGTPDETARMRAELKHRTQHDVHIVAELTLQGTPTPTLVAMLHDHSINGVLLSSKHSYFDQVESIIRACELEGVEAWLIADFFKTQISRTSFDDFCGHPVLVFRTTPDASWQGVFKQLIDYVGALLALIVLAIPLLIIGLLVKLSSPGPILFR